MAARSAFLTLLVMTSILGPARVRAQGRDDGAAPYARAGASVAVHERADLPRPPRRPAAPDLTSTLPLPAGCQQRYANANRALALDAANTAYAVATCLEGVIVTASTTSGASWSTPVIVAAGYASGATIGGGTLPGHALVAWTVESSVLVSVTTNYGASFTPPVIVMSGAGALSVAQGLSALAVGDWYHVMLARPPSGAVTVRSPDRGQSWLPEVYVPSPWVFGDLLHDADTGFVELMSDNPSVFRSTSMDAGASYSAFAPLPGTCCIYYSDWALSCGRAYATGNVENGPVADLIWRYDLRAGLRLEQVMTLPSTRMRERTVTVDSSGDGFTAGTEQSGTVQLIRWRADSALPDAPILVAASGSDPHVVACGAGTVHVTHRDSEGLIQFSSFCLGTSCCAGGSCAVPAITLLRNADLTRLDPPSPALATLLLPGDGSGRPGATALDSAAPAQRFPDFVPGPLAGELAGPSTALVYYELEEPDARGRLLRLSKAGPDLLIEF